MPNFDKNLYYCPEASGLEVLGELEFSPSYEFDLFVVWREKATGRLAYGQDSGCSCPCPFEWFEVEDLIFAEPWEITQKISTVANEKKSAGYWGASDNDVVNLIEKVVNAR
ncbi:DUF7574 domain-containing protein [Actinomadura oligospora]|uniref:DUF7574 domain-containing protein n=1 Tax=Actinomadura oligospora TaxID=111804 RepID=UPI0012F97101|nr:hypothetical protein [Actinomadura oligospora]